MFETFDSTKAFDYAYLWFDGQLRNILFTAGPVCAKWATAGPVAKWNPSQVHAKWAVAEPRSI